MNFISKIGNQTTNNISGNKDEKYWRKESDEKINTRFLLSLFGHALIDQHHHRVTSSITVTSSIKVTNSIRA